MQKYGHFLVIFMFLFFECQCLTRSAMRQMTDLNPRVNDAAKELLQIVKNSANSTGYGKTVIPHISNECTWTLGNFTNSSSVGKYIDASGKLPSGIEEGNFLSIGSYSLCESIPSSHYCMVNINAFLYKKKVSIRWGLCITNKCSESDIAYGLEDIIKDVFHIKKNKVFVSTMTSPRSVYCAKPSEYTPGAICCLFICAVLCFLCLLGTVLDLIESTSLSISIKKEETIHVQNGMVVPKNDDTENLIPSHLNISKSEPDHDHVQLHAKKKNIVVRILLCFSIVKNTKKIMDTDVPPGAISSINGMRVLSITWVILGHTYLFILMSGIVDNPLSSIGIINRFSFQAIDNAFLSVDSFFFLSGLLVCYLGLRRMSKNDGHLPMFKFYFHRLWRLTPTYMFVIWFYTTLDPHLNKGPLWYTHQLGNQCHKYWWTNLLYINNFYPVQLVQECLGWSWYLANDMQFYVISPILLYLMYRFKNRGLLAGVGGLLQASLIVTATIIGVYNLPTSMVSEVQGGAGQNKTENKINNYTNWVYIKPYCRIAPYLVGMALGYIFFMDKKHSFIRKLKPNKRWVLVLLGWLVAVALGIATVYGMYSQNKVNGKPFSRAVNVIYGALFRFLWAVALAWVIYACQTGFGGLVNSILSAKFWIPLSRLTYGTYLVHIIVLGVFFGGFQHEIAYTDILLVFYFVSTVAISYGIAFILAIAVEFPLMQMEQLFLK